MAQDTLTLQASMTWTEVVEGERHDLDPRDRELEIYEGELRRSTSASLVLPSIMVASILLPATVACGAPLWLTSTLGLLGYVVILFWSLFSEREFFREWLWRLEQRWRRLRGLKAYRRAALIESSWQAPVEVELGATPEGAHLAWRLAGSGRRCLEQRDLGRAHEQVRSLPAPPALEGRIQPGRVGLDLARDPHDPDRVTLALSGRTREERLTVGLDAACFEPAALASMPVMARQAMELDAEAQRALLGWVATWGAALGWELPLALTVAARAEVTASS